MKKLVVLLAGASLLATSGCAVNRAFNKPAPKDLSFLEVNADRDTVRAELGDHEVSSDSAQCDVHAFTEGSGGFKYLRGVTYSIFDLATLGITEIFFNPIEAAIGNDKVRLRACYSAANKLQKVERLERGRNVLLIAAPMLPEASPAPTVVQSE